MSQYKELLQHILDKGYRKGDRTGVGTISTFGYQCRFDLKEGFPIVTEKKTAFKAAITELVWMIGGWMKEEAYQGVQRTNIKYLIDNGVKIWTEWPYKAYCQYAGSLEEPDYDVHIDDPKQNCTRILTQEEYENRIAGNKEFAIRFGDLGPVYQKQWRDFEGKKNSVDQLMVMIDRLKTNPDDRRNLTSYWNPTELDEMLLPPCHLLHQVWTRPLAPIERYALVSGEIDVDNPAFHDALDKLKVPTRAISLQMYQRSSDCFLGVPFDWVWYAALTHMLAEQTNMIVDEFVWTSGDTHLYTNSLEETNTVLASETFPYPKLWINPEVKHIEDYKVSDFKLIDYKSGPAIRVAVAV